jgi:peptidoglycan hydrolase CwlO-like protein
MKKKVISGLIVVIVLVSMFTGCIEERTSESTDQKPAKREWQPPNPGAFEHAARISDKASQIGQEHNARMNQLTTDIAARNAKIDQWSKDHDARINELNSKMAEQSARIDQWSKEHNDRINELNSKIAEQNANIDELVKDIATQNAKICEEVRILQTNINNIAAQNAEITKQMEEYNARIDGHIKKIEAQNARIDQWSKDYNERLNGLESDIEARNAVIYEAVAQAQEHIDELNRLTNALLEDVIHMWEDMAIGVIAPPVYVPGVGNVPENILRNILKIEQRKYNFENLGCLPKIPGMVNQITLTANYITINHDALKNLEHTPELVKITETTIQSIENVNVYVNIQVDNMIIYVEKISKIIITISEHYALI